MTEHTPTPWSWSNSNLVRIRQSTLTIAGIHRIGRVADMRTAQAQAEANAEFIVRACNAHDELVAAVERFIAWVDSGEDGFPDEGKLHAAMKSGRAALAKARAALARAKEGAA